MIRKELGKFIMGSSDIIIEYSPLKMIVFTTGATQLQGRLAVQSSPTSKGNIMQLESIFKVDPKKGKPTLVYIFQRT